MEVPGERANLPRELLPGGRRCSVVRPSPGLEQHPVSPAGNSQRDQHIVQNRLLWDRFEEFPANGINSPGHADRRVHATLVIPDELLVAPVRGDPLTDGGTVRVSRQDELTAHRAHTRIPKVAYQSAEGSWLEPLPDICKDHDLPQHLR